MSATYPAVKRGAKCPSMIEAFHYETTASEESAERASGPSLVKGKVRDASVERASVAKEAEIDIRRLEDGWLHNLISLRFERFNLGAPRP